MIIAKPDADDILCGAATATGTVVTVPAGRVFVCDIAMSAAQSVLGTSVANLGWVVGGTGCGPAVNTIVAHCIVVGLATGVSTNHTRITGVFHGGDAGGHLAFATGGASSASCAITGFLI